MIERSLLHHLIRGSGHLRGARKEWFHFCVLGEGIELIVNFSCMEHTSRVAVLVKLAGAEWDGDVELVPAEHVRVRRGSMDLDFAHHHLRFTQEHGFEITCALAERPISLQLELEPATIPLLRPNTQLASGPIHWMVVPRLVAKGTVCAGGRRVTFTGAPAYHDHNWGEFAWGDDFAWQWGFALPPAVAAASASADDALAIALVRLVDRTRTQDIGHGLFIWKGAEQHRIFREGELTIHPTGFHRPTRLLRLPRAMSLTNPELPTDAPAQIHITATGRGDHLQITFTTHDLFQLLIPHETDLGTTAINELAGTYAIKGHLSGTAIDLRAPGYFEHLTVSSGRSLAQKTSAPPSANPPPRAADTFAEFLRASLQHLREETPAIYSAMCAALEGQIVALTVDGESLTLAFARTEALESHHLRATVSLATDTASILALCDDHLTLASAVLSDRVLLHGTPADLITFEEGLALYLAGAMRAPSFTDLLHDFRAAARAHTKRTPA